MPASSKIQLSPEEIIERSRHESAAQIARDAGVTRHAIEKRIARHQELDESGNQSTDWYMIVARDFYPAGDKDSIEIRAEILKNIEEGATVESATRAAGISPDTWKRWRESDAALAACHDKAQGRVEMLAEKRFLAGSERDWRAAQAYLAQNPNSRNRWGNSQGEESGGITVVLNVAPPRILSESEEAAILRPVIDVDVS